MKKLLVAILALAGAGIVQAQIKVAVVNVQKALLDTADLKKAQAEMEAKYKPRQDKIVQLQKELQDIQNQLQSGRLNQLGTDQAQAEGQKKQRDLQRMQQDLQDDVTQERNDILQRAGTRMQDVVKKLAEEKGVDLVIDSTNTLYYKAAFDLTADATAAYNKAYPVPVK
ncbi:MAG TPA: OmpH family outer membrane protein [Bryobacteraceae bacterium]|nr:OmpH family outer membrane protein [Bryobacteraceae bacterium]HUO31633.1 OmpH family outer membrane protein [Bryobacteraceae bacterium]